MAGFETVETSTDALDGGSGTQAAAVALEDLLGGEPAGEQVEQAAEAAHDPDAPEPIGGEAQNDDFQEQPDQTSGQEEAQTYAIKVHGEERQVTLNELREGFQLKSDYTRSKQDLANERQQLGLEAQQVSQQRDQYGNLLSDVGQRLQAMIPPEPDWASLAATDPIAHTRQRAAWDQLQGQVKQVETEQKRIAQEQQQDFGTRMQAYLAQQQASMLDRRPELKDREKATSFFTAINNYAANEYGFTQAEMSGVMDHRVFLMAEKAMKWDQAQAAAGSKANPRAHVPTLKPGPRQKTETKTSANLRKARNRLSRSGSTKDAAAAIETML